MTGGHELTLFTEEGRVVDHEEHRHGRLVDGNRRHGLWILQVADGVANLKLLQSDDGTDITAIDTLRAYMRHTLKGMQFLDLCLLQRTVTMSDGHLHTVLQLSTMYTTHGDTALIARIVERGDQHLRCTLYLLRSRNHLDNLIQQISDIVGRRLPVLTHPAILGRTINHPEVELILGSVQREHQVEHHLIDLFRTAVGLIHLIDHHNRLQTDLQGLLQHEARLGHRTLKGIDEQQTAVGHVQHTLHLTTEIGVSRGINNINLRSFPIDADVL